MEILFMVANSFNTYFLFIVTKVMEVPEYHKWMDSRISPNKLVDLKAID